MENARITADLNQEMTQAQGMSRCLLRGAPLLPSFRCKLVAVFLAAVWLSGGLRAAAQTEHTNSRFAPGFAPGQNTVTPESEAYRQVQQRLAQGWNTWDVHSVMTQVLLPEGLAIHASLKNNSTGGGGAFLQDALIGRLTPGAEQVTPGPHSWDGSYTDLRIAWHGHNWRMQSARNDNDVVILATPLPGKNESALPPSIIFTVDFLWNRTGTGPEPRYDGPISSRHRAPRE
jgi:hypothetical protein